MAAEDPVDIILRLLNLPGFLAGTKEAAAGIREIGAATEETDAANAAAAGSSGRMAGALGLMARASRVGALAFAAAAAEGTKLSINFDKQMEMIHTQAGASQEQVKNLSGEILGMAKSGQYAQTPEELAKGLYHLISVGMPAAKALQALKVASQGAAVGNANLEDTTTALASAWLTGIKGAGDFNHVMALANATVGAGNMRMQDLVTSMGTGVLPAAKAAGLGITDVFSALAILSDEGWKGSSAMAQFATSLHFLTNPTQKAQGALAAMHLSSTSLARDMRSPGGLLAALTDLKKHMEAYSKDPVKQQQLLGDILPGGRGRVLMVLMNQLDRLGLKQKQIARTTGQFGDDVQKTHETTAFKLHAAWSQVEAELIGVGHSLQKPLAGLAHFAAVALGWFLKLPSGVKIATAAVLAFGALFATGGWVAVAIGAAVVLIVLLVNHWKDIQKFLQPVINWLTGAFKWVAGQLGLSGKDFGGWGKTLQGIWNKLLAFFKAAFNVWKFLWNNVFLHVVKLAIPIVVNTFKGMLNVIGGLVKIFSGIFTGDWHRVWDGVKQVFKGALHFLVASILLAAAPFRVAWDIIKKIAAAAWNNIVSVIKNIWNGLLNFFKGAPSTIFNLFKTVWNGIYTAFKWAINQLISAWNSLHFTIGGWTLHLPDPAPNITVPKITVGLPHIPTLATGGIIMTPGSVIVGEEGPELLHLPRGAGVQPLKRDRHHGVTAIDTQISKDIKHTTIIQVDRRELARAVSRFSDDQTARA
jgi:TP901 family phage tail tape measure protein